MGRHQPPAIGAAILQVDGAARESHEAEDDIIFQQRLPALTTFKAEGGDWGAFQRRFLAHQEMSAWSDATALRALPAMLDDNALAAFRSAPRSARSTLKAALGLMAKVYGPPSACRLQFYERRKADTETALAYRTALLALADAAFPRMDEEGKDAMVLEQLLKLAQDLGVPINTADEVDICSLRVATSIQAHEVLKRKQGVVCTAAAVSAPASVVIEPQVVRPREEAFAAARPGDWRSGGRSPLRSTRKLEQPRPPTSLVTCYNCGLRGHVASGCRAPRQRATGPRLDDDQGPKSSKLPPASRGTSHARPIYTTHMGRRFAAEDVRLGVGDSVRRGGFVRSRGDIKWSELGHRIVAAAAGSSVVTGFIDGVEVCEAQVDWDLQVPGVLAAYRMAPHAATGFSPFYLMYGREADPPMETQLGLSVPRPNFKCLGTDGCRPAATGSPRHGRFFQACSMPPGAAGATGRSTTSCPVRRTGQADSR
ncbi:unnamed protein product [Lampetra fluviatilis]